MARPILVLGYPVDRHGRPIDPGFGVGGGPIDPGFGVGEGGGIDNSLPGDQPGIDNSLPPDPGHPWLPGHRPPHIGGGPIPSLPPRLNPPPVQIWPPSAPVFPIPPGTPDNELPIPPGAIWPPLPPGMPEGQILVLVYITGIGWRWTVIDTTLEVDNGLPPEPVPAPK
jgi:hypothetical protein